MNRRSFVKFLSCSPLFSIFKVNANQDYLIDPDNWYVKPQQGETVHYSKLPDGTLSETCPGTIEELTEMMEARIPVGPSTNFKWSVTGEEYKEVKIGCRDPNEAKIKALVSSQWGTFLKEVRENPYGKLYWRIKPEYSMWEDLGLHKSKIYTRYLVSNKPEKWLIADGFFVEIPVETPIDPGMV